MYGFPFLDISGEYGISTRDNYLICGETAPHAVKKNIISTKKNKKINNSDYSLQDLKQIQAFLSTKFALFIFSTTNYRMRYLEKYAFQFLPDITKIPNFPDLQNLPQTERDKKIQDFFNFSPTDKEIIENYSKDYKFFT